MLLSVSTYIVKFPDQCPAEAPEYLLELLNDKNRAICKLCAKTLDIVAVSHTLTPATESASHYRILEWVAIILDCI